MNALVGDRAERYELPIESRRPIYVRPAIHPDPSRRPPIDWRIAAAWGVPMFIGWTFFALCVRWALDLLFFHLR